MASRSRSLIDEFLCFTKQIALEMVRADIELVIYLIDKNLPEEKVSEIKKAALPGVQLVSCLMEYRLLSENNLDYFIELLKESHRVDLADRVKEYQKTVITVTNAPQAKIEVKIPAPNMESLSLVMPGQPDNITVKQLDHIRECVRRAIDLKPSELFYVATEDDENPFCSQLSLQFPRIEEKITKLQLDAVNKKPWLMDLKVVELKVDNNSSIKMLDGRDICTQFKSMSLIRA